jgi:DnaJ like chaperone protein
MPLWKRLRRAATEFAHAQSWSDYFRRLCDGGGVAVAERETAPEDRVAFTMALIALAAKMARSDGVVLPAEVRAFRKLLEVPPQEVANVERLFALAQADVAGYEAYADQVAVMFDRDKERLALVLEGLFLIATADKALHPDEDGYLADIARRFGMSESEYLHLRSRFVEAPGTSPFGVLGLEPSASDAEVKAAFRRLARENHPDVLTAKGVPAELTTLATRKMQAITEAYRAIAKERGL